MKKRLWLILLVCVVLGTGAFAGATRSALLPTPGSLHQLVSDVQRLQVVDRRGAALTISYRNRWNTHDYLQLHEIPELLQKVFVLAEDKRFYEHNGPDWYARCHALVQNVSSLDAVRGASTITEQVIRMIHPRPRTIWSRWLEGLEARRLEQKVTKSSILEFYLNQVPYAANRRGVLQASRYYFDRDIDTLSPKEMAALAVLVRAPSSYDLYRRPDGIDGLLKQLGTRLLRNGVLSDRQFEAMGEGAFELSEPKLPVSAPHFVRYIFKHSPEPIGENRLRINTTLDSSIQRNVKAIIDRRVRDLNPRRVHNGAALVVDHANNEILAWAVAGRGDGDMPAGSYDAVTTPRQPGSALKPFLYALAIEKGWTAATSISDSPLFEPVGAGLHTYRNYNRLFYGIVSLRQALGNSLNIPAIRAIRFVGVDVYLSRLREIGFKSLRGHPDFYGDGLALGNGGVTLFELVQAYALLARGGDYMPLAALQEETGRAATSVFSREVTSIIGSILSDPEARSLEFGNDSLLNFPLQTAVKTGTSSDYRDAWAVGYNYRYTAGVWMGNLDGTQTDGVTGASGPAMALRTIFSELSRFKETRPLYLSPKLVQHNVCDPTHQTEDAACSERTEWFIAGTEPEEMMPAPLETVVRFRQPTRGLNLAMDPRIPDQYEAFEFQITGLLGNEIVDWSVNGEVVGRTRGGRYLWDLERGSHIVKATVWNAQNRPHETEAVRFFVR